MSDHPRKIYAKKYPAQSQLLVEVLANQCHPDCLECAVADHAQNSDKQELAEVARELDVAVADPGSSHEYLGRITNYDLNTGEDARAFLRKLRLDLGTL